MTRDRAAVKKIVQGAIKNNLRVIVALILVLGGSSGDRARRLSEAPRPRIPSTRSRRATTRHRSNIAGGEPTRSLRAGLGQRPCGGQGPLRAGCRGGAAYRPAPEAVVQDPACGRIWFRRAGPRYGAVRARARRRRPTGTRRSRRG